MREPFASRRMGLALLVVAGLTQLALPAAAAELTRHTVAVEGHPLAVWAKAPDRSRAVMLLVHGRTWSTRPDFDLQVPGEEKSLMDGLVALGIAAYGVDLRGYGETPRDGSGWLTPRRAAADVAHVLDWLQARHPGLDAPALFGWSYGAMVAQLVAQLHPGRLSGLVLFGYPVRPGVDVSPPDATGPAPRRPTTAAAAASDFIVPGAISQAAMDAFVAAALAADPIRADWRALEEWRLLDAAAVRTPTLLLDGEHDPLTRQDVQAALFDGLGVPDKAWVVLPGGDHAAFMETPRDYFLATIGNFILRSR